MRKNSNSGSARGGVGIYRCYLCKGDEEESTNHILLHCSKVAMLSQLILLAWSFCRKEEERLLCVYFGPYGRSEIKEPLKIQKW